jgi:hypothetical protein
MKTIFEGIAWTAFAGRPCHALGFARKPSMAMNFSDVLSMNKTADFQRVTVISEISPREIERGRRSRHRKVTEADEDFSRIASDYLSDSPIMESDF